MLQRPINARGVDRAISQGKPLRVSRQEPNIWRGRRSRLREGEEALALVDANKIRRRILTGEIDQVRARSAADIQDDLLRFDFQRSP